MKRLIGVLAAITMLLAGCGGPGPKGAAPAPTTPPTPTVARPAPTDTAARPAPTHAAPSRTPRPTESATPVPPTATDTPTRTAVPSPTPALPTVTDTAAPSATPTARPSPTPAGPQSWLAANTVLTIYGRGFGIAPTLGRLGIDNNFADLEWQIQPFARNVKAFTGGKDPIIAVHLIYGMALGGCGLQSKCLLYLDDTGVDLVKTYIEPAARRHWLVVLDDQLARSDPVSEVQRLIAKGYLRYDNVEIALDPEFRAAPGQDTPGIPIGTVTAQEINAAQAIVNAYCAHRRLPHRKILMIHQFRFSMIDNRAALRSDFPYVDPVIDADGLGTPGTKADVYTQLLGYTAPGGVRWRGLKLFYPNPYTDSGHTDVPTMTWPQVFGRVPAVDFDGKSYRVRPIPNIIVIA